MQGLLPGFERELAFLKEHAGDFARSYPKIAGQLLLSGDAGEDPHVERMIQSFALLSARIHKRLDDDFPLFTESFLEVLYPHYLRPFPSCSIARFGMEGTSIESKISALFPRGTYVNTQLVRGVTCRFKTAYDVNLMPMRIAGLRYRGAVGAPSGTAIPKGASACLSVQVELLESSLTWASLPVQALRLYVDGEASQVSALREALCGRAVAVFAQAGSGGAWLPGGDAMPQAVGFAEPEALIEFDARSHPAYRLLTEFFSFPEKFNFVDLPLPKALLDLPDKRITLHYVMEGLRSDSDDAQLLETLSEKNLLMGCTPVVNLFGLRADPIQINHLRSTYTVLPDSRRAFAFEVHSIDKVYRMQQTNEGEAVVEFRPFYSLQHEQLLDEADMGGRYWSMQRDEAMALHSPGYETEISIVDIDFDPSRIQIDTLSVDVTATNRNLPSLLQVGGDGGELFADGGGKTCGIRLLRRPTQTCRFVSGRGAHWRLISQLSLNHLTLSAGGLDALKEILRLYDLPRSAITRRQIEGILAIDCKPSSACLPGNPFPVFVRGTEIILQVDEQNFVGTGLRLFAQVLDRFFGLYAHANSFVELTLTSSRNQIELMKFPRRSGQCPLL